MEATSFLQDSLHCRLCGEENPNGTNLYPTPENPQDLSVLINKYLPLKIQNDDQFPKKICPGCHIQLEATKIFLDLIIDGQERLRNMLKAQQELLKRQEKQRAQLEQVLHTVNPNTKVETYTIESDDTGEKFLIQILSDGPLFPPEHQMTLRSEGLEKPRKKRGRPPKPPPEAKPEIVQKEPEQKPISDEDVEEDVEGRRKRKIKAPTRFQDIVQGKELDKILKAEGVIDDENIGGPETESNANEVIGRMESGEGENLGDLIMSNNRLKTRAKPGILRKRRKYHCSICKKEFLHFGRFNLHKRSHKVVYKCQEEGCDFRNEDKTAVETHQTETSHNGIQAVEPVHVIGELELPGDKIDTVAEEEPSPSQYQCDACNKSFANKQNFETHCKSVHKQERPYVCSKCGKRFAHPNTLRLHYIRHTKESGSDALRQYSCDKCPRVFTHPSSLLYHRDSQHSNGRRFVCNQCNKGFKHRQLLQRHQLVHTEDRPYKCTNCKAAFKTRANLINHQSLHSGARKYWCPQCGQSFVHKTSLTLHQRWHTGQKPYQCDVCNKMFSQKGNLAEHRRIHTGEKPYCCDYCGRAFTTSSQLRLHRKRHTGEKPWRCDYCNKSFLHKDTWKCHLRRHLNDQPYKCRVCEKAFTEAWALKKHERLHTGEKPFKCDRCGRMFADNSNMTKHRRTHDIYNIKDATVVQIVDTDMNDVDKGLEKLDGMELRQLIDQQGNPISLTTQDGQQVPVVTGGSDESLQGLLPDGTLVPINIGEVGEKVDQDLGELDDGQSLSLPNNLQFLSTETVVDNVNGVGEKSDNMKELDTSIHFLTTENGEGVCLVYEMNENEPTATLNPQFLTISES